MTAAHYNGIRHVGPVEAVRLAFQNYFDFSGRAQRSEYWWFFLFTLVAGAVLEGVDALILGFEDFDDYLDADFTPLYTVFVLLTFIPSLSVAWRRMHDIGRSGWWNMLWIAPLLWAGLGTGMLFASDQQFTLTMGILLAAGVIFTIACIVYTIVLLATDSEPRTNRYGPSPKYGDFDDIHDARS